jgi:predicted dienelactone hydrolase
MTIADVLLIAAIAALLATWWLYQGSARGRVLLVSALVVVTAGAWDVWDHRWQAGAGVVAGAVFLLVLAISRGRKPIRKIARYASGVLLSIAGAVAIAAIYLFPVWRLPTPTGEHAVGARTFELDDASRLGVFAAKDNEPRRLLVRVWYPAVPEESSRPMPYFSAAEADTTARSMGEMMGFPPLLTYLKHVLTHSYEDAPLVAGAANLPTIFYSHGYGSFLGQNWVLMEELASHGYVVFSVQHTYDSSATVFPDGSVAPTDPAISAEARAAEEKSEALPEAMIQGFTEADFDKRLEGQLAYAGKSLDEDARISKESALVWAADQLFVHDRLQGGDVPEAIKPIAAACDLARTGEMGMSFGGATAGVVCMLDKRCVAAVNLDGGNFPFLPFNADLPVPFLMVHSDLAKFYQALGVTGDGPKRSFNDFSYESLDRAGEREDVCRLEVKQAAHLGFSDFSLFMRRPLRDPLLGTTPTAVLIGVQNDLVRAFFDKHLRNGDGDFPADPVRKYADWVTTYKNDGLREWWLAKPAEERTAIESRISELKRKMNWDSLRRE